MRLHTKLDYIGVAYALQQAKRAGYVTGDVTFIGGLKPYGSRTHPRAFEVQLGTCDKHSLPADYRDQHGERLHVRRFKNTGDSGASSERATGENIWAATWDEWGWFIAYVFAADPDARFGHYNSYADFTAKTAGRFDLSAAIDAAVEDMRRVQRNLDEDRVNHDTVREQTGEDA